MYNKALEDANERRFNLCIEGFHSLHEEVPEGYNDSKQKLTQCRDALEAQRQKEEDLAREKAAKEAEERASLAAENCVKDYKEGKIRTVSELDLCVKNQNEDPVMVRADPRITEIQLEIEEKERAEEMKRRKKEEWAKTLKAKRALYYKAKRVADSEAEVSKKVAAYNRFIRAAGKISSLQKLKKQAEEERDAIGKAYDDKLQALVDGCSNPMKEQKLKEAFSNCKKLLDFRPDNKEAQENIEKVTLILEKELKPKYEESVIQESFANIKEAKQIWQAIVKRDIAGGRYYKKAKTQLEKYSKDYTK